MAPTTFPSPAVDRLLDADEVAALTNLTPRQVARARQTVKLGCVRLSGSAVLHTRAQVDASIASSTTDAK